MTIPRQFIQSVHSITYKTVANGLSVAGEITDYTVDHTVRWSNLQPLITVRNEVAKVMFLHLSVCPHGGGVCLSACWDSTPWSRHPPGVGTPPPRSRHPPADGYCCGRYASTGMHPFSSGQALSHDYLNGGTCFVFVLLNFIIRGQHKGRMVKL